MLLTDSSVYVDKEALSCQTGQLSEPNAEPQHLSGWLAESCQRGASPWARTQHACLSVNRATHLR